MIKNAPPRQLGISDRKWALDYLRIALALLIFLFHSRIHLICDYGLFNAFVDAGNIAMTGFFMLSGYSLYIAYPKLEVQSKIDVVSFYKKRLLSVYPLYITTTILFVIMVVVAKQQSLLDNIILLPIELLGIQSFFHNSLFQYSMNGGSWFISCLLFCYLFFPFIKEMFQGWKSKYCIFLSVLITCILSYSPFISSYYADSELYVNPLFRMLEFILGVLIAVLNESTCYKNQRKGRERLLLISIIIVLVISVSVLHYFRLNKETPVVICFYIMIMVLSRMRAKGGARLLYFSKITYAFFLVQVFVNLPIKFYLRQIGDIPNIVKILVSFSACIILSIFFYEMVDRRIGGWLKQKLL